MSDEETLRAVQGRLSAEFDLKRLVIESKRVDARGRLVYSIFAIAETRLPLVERNGVAIMAMQDAEIEADIAVFTPEEAADASPSSLLAHAMQADVERRRTLIESAREPNRFFGPSGGHSERRGQMHEAFGETMTSAEWSQDDRCVVSLDALSKRLRRGWPMEAAMIFGENWGRDLYWAFGERKSLSDWLCDPRLKHAGADFKRRLDEGSSLEAALGLEQDAEPAVTQVAGRFFLEIEGERKGLQEWLRDPRCEIAMTTLHNRIKRGWPGRPDILKHLTDHKTKIAYRYEVRLSDGTALGAFQSSRRAHTELAAKAVDGHVFDLIKAVSVDPPPVRLCLEPFVARRGRSSRLFAAFGETMTPGEWSRHDRCVVRYSTLFHRLECGWPIEAALVVPTPITRRVFDAFGKAQAIQDWLADPCCAVPPSILLARLAAGESLEAALTRPEAGYQAEAWPRFANRPRRDDTKRKYEAFGEARTVTQWAKDARCVVSLAVLQHRIYAGIPAETAMIFGEYGLMSRYWAFGERRTLTEWLRDPRLKHVGADFKRRLDEGAPLEDALGITPATEPAMTRLRGQILIEIEGERKSATRWAKDPRCDICKTYLVGRIKRGWPATLDILKYSTNNKKSLTYRYEARLSNGTVLGGYSTTRHAYAALAEHGVGGQVFDSLIGAVYEPRPEPIRVRPRRYGGPYEQHTALGETKTLEEWAADPRCRVPAHRLGGRLARGWPSEAAIVLPTAWHHARPRAFGIADSIQNWLADPRCAVPPSVLLERMALGELFESALTRPEPGHPPEVWIKGTEPTRNPYRALEAARATLEQSYRRFEAFGQTLTVAEWAHDERCVVSLGTLAARLKRGWPIQAALLIPNLGNGDLLDAFGKGQPIQDWLADPICVVPPSILLARLAAREPLESALTRSEPGHQPEVWPRFQNRPMRDAKKCKYEAFGEARTITQWAKDPRCVVGLRVLEDRISKGIPAEAAMIYSQY